MVTPIRDRKKKLHLEMQLCPSEIERKSCIWKCNFLLCLDGFREKLHNSGAGET